MGGGENDRAARSNRKTSEGVAPSSRPVGNPQKDGEVAKKQKAKAADSSVLAKALRDATTRSGGVGSFRGSVLSSLYGLPQDRSRAVRTLQSFNGKQAGSGPMKLGQ